MRKRLIPYADVPANEPATKWLDVAEIAEVEVTSERETNPIEEAVVPGRTGSWIARAPGMQRIRLLFDAPQAIRRIRVRFDAEEGPERTQEFRLSCVRRGLDRQQEILRQQYNFSPNGARFEVEDYTVSLENVEVLELTIVPDINGREALASLSELRLA